MLCFFVLLFLQVLHLMIHVSFDFKFNLFLTCKLYVSHHAGSRSYGYGGGQYQIRVKDMQCICDWAVALHQPFISPLASLNESIKCFILICREMMFRAGGALLSHRHIISSFCATWITAAGKMEWNVGKFNQVAAAFVQTLPLGMPPTP